MKRFNPYTATVMDEQNLRSDTFDRPYTEWMGAQEGLLRAVLCCAVLCFGLGLAAFKPAA